MSIKFFSGLQDLLGLYDASIASTSHSTAHIPPSNGLFSPTTTGTSSLLRRKSAGEHNHALGNEAGDDDVQISKCSHDRKVRFDDDQLISGYCEASAPSFAINEEAQTDGCKEGPNVEEILQSYRKSCQKVGIQAIASVERQLEKMQRTPCTRQEVFSLKGERVSAEQMEALEEVFRRVQFDMLDFEYTFLDDDAAIALSEMFEFYESAQKLNLSFNKQITIRGWTDVFKAVKNSNCLQMLNLRYTSLSEKSLSALCRMLRGTPQPALVCLHLENVNLFGRNLYSLVCALKFNTVLKELYLGENSIQSADGAHLYQLILNNFTLQMIDLRNNQLGDAGVAKMFEALRNPEVIKKSALTAIVLWNNKISAAGMESIAAALCENPHLETLNIGSNPLGETGVQRLRPALGANASNLRRLGLQNTQMTCQSAILLAECLADNSTLIRVDLRDNPAIGSAGLLAIHSAMKINESISLLNLDQSCVVPTNAKVRQYQEDFRRYYEDIKRYCERNKLATLQKTDLSPETVVVDATLKSDKSDAQENASYTDPLALLGSPIDSPSNTDVPPLNCQSSQTSPIACPRAKRGFIRSSSLTCAETVTDIHERIKVMGGSSTSLDETNSDSTKTIKKADASTHGSIGLGKLKRPIAEWGSLPAISEASGTTKPVVRKFRRFSVSPSSSTFDVSTTSNKPSTSTIPEVPNRPTTLSIVVPAANSVSKGPVSAPVSASSSQSSSVTENPPAKDKVCDEGGSKQESAVTTKTTQQPAQNEECTRLHPDVSNEKRCEKDVHTPYPKSATDKLPEQRDSRSSSEEPHDTVEDVMKDVRTVIADLINYVEYEESLTVERKHSMLLQTSAFTDSELSVLRSRTSEESPRSGTILTPSRMVNIAEEVAETDEMVVSSVMRSLVREVLKKEKEELRSTLDRRRKRTGVTSSKSSTPV